MNNLQALATHIREEVDYMRKEGRPRLTVMIAVDDAEQIATALEREQKFDDAERFIYGKNQPQ